MQSNIQDLEKHLRKIFGELFMTQSFADKASFIGESLRGKVLEMMNSSYYHYNQSGNLRHLVRTTDDGYMATKTKVKIGFGSLEDLSDSRYSKRPSQTATFFGGTDYKKTITFGSEPDLPEWIIAEFGRKAGSGVSSSNVPSEFKVNYNPRDADKIFMAGPSDTRHYRQHIYFMASRKKIQSLFPSEPIDDLRTHPGITAGHIFSGGLQSSKGAIREKFGEAILASLTEIARKNGGRVE